MASKNLVLLEDRGLGWYVADGRERGFCRECGASLFWRRAGAPGTSIAAGTLQEPTGLATVAHTFVDSRGDYYELGDELPRFGASRNSAPEGGAMSPRSLQDDRRCPGRSESAADLALIRR